MVERTESRIVSVNPNYENDKIEEMQHFGWSLQNRQEIMGYLRESEPHNMWDAAIHGFYEGSGKKFVEYDHYVKLHFVRDIGLKNLTQIKKLEEEYFSLPIPTFPTINWFSGGWKFWSSLFTYKRKKVEAQATLENTQRRAREIIRQVTELLES